MNSTSPERVCPLCGQDNNCQHNEATCWCASVKIPKYILDMIPEDKKGKACICKACLDRLQEENEVK